MLNIPVDCTNNPDSDSGNGSDIQSNLQIEDNIIISSHSETRINKRKKTKLSEDDIRSNGLDLDVVRPQIKRIKEKSPIYDNQKSAAHSIMALIWDLTKICIMCLGEMQSGKTGTILELLNLIFSYPDIIFPVKNVYIITGLSSTEWMEQTKNRIPGELHENVYHRDKLNDFAKSIKNKKNVLIIMDEVQIAAKNKQTISKVFKEANLKNLNYLLENNIVIVDFTATPDGVLCDLLNWKDDINNRVYFDKVILEPGDGYIGPEYLLNYRDENDGKRVYECKDLCCMENGKVNKEMAYKNIREFKSICKDFEEPLYHLIRIPTDSKEKQNKTIENIKDIFPESEYDYIVYDQSYKGDINSVLKTQPKKHTLILVKEKLRCSKTLKKKFLGILYDRYVKDFNDSTIIQSFIGRMSGYDDSGLSICFTNIESIERYIKRWNSRFEDENLPWKSNSTRSVDGKTISVHTYTNVEDMVGFGNHPDDKNINRKRKWKVRSNLDNIEELKKFCCNTLGKKRCDGPRKKSKNKDGNKDGFIPYKGVVYDIKEVNKFKDKQKVNNNTYYIPYYTNLNDNNTLKWAVVYLDRS